MELIAEEVGYQILSLARFPHLLDSAICTQKSVQLNFGRKEHLDVAIKQWNWVNNKHKNKIVLITYSQHCDLGKEDKDDVQVWEVDRIQNDTTAKSMTLSATPKEIVDVFKNWHLQADSRGIGHAKSPRGRRKRDINKSVQINVDFDFAHILDTKLGFCWGGGGSQNILAANSKTDSAVGCLSLNTGHTYGMFDFVLSIQPNPFQKNLGGSIELIANDVGATVMTDVAVYKSNVEAVPYEQEVLGVVPPIAGIYVKGLIDIGPTLKVSLSTSIGENPEPLSIQTGFNISIPSGSSFKLALGDAGKSDAKGWIPKFDIIGPSMSNNFSLTATVGPRIDMYVEAQMFGLGASAGFTWAAAELNITAKSVDKAPFCGKPNAKQGVSFEVELGTHLDAVVDSSFFGKDTGKTWPLASASTQLASLCQAIDQPTQVAPPTQMPSTSIEQFIPAGLANGGIAGLAHAGIASASSVASKGVSVATSVFKEATSTVASVVNEVTNAVESIFDGIF